MLEPRPDETEVIKPVIEGSAGNNDDPAIGDAARWASILFVGVGAVTTK